MTTTMIRKDFWAVRFADKGAAVRFVNRAWTFDGKAFATRTAAIAAAAAVVMA